MRKNQSKFKDKQYVDQLINKLLEKYRNIIYLYSKDNYVYFSCSTHGNFRKRLDHLVEIKHHACPKCSKVIYAKIVGKTLVSKHSFDEYVDLEKYEPLENYNGAGVLTRFKCKIHDIEFVAKPYRCFGCDTCKKEHHYKWGKRLATH